MDAVSPMRTVCHGCRQVTQYRDVEDNGRARLRPMLIPGNGAMFRERAPGIMTEEPCPMCGDSDDPGWLAGFVPPV